MLWEAEVAGKAVWIYRWRGCSLHIAELISDTSLRRELNLGDGDRVTIEIQPRHIDRISFGTRAVWTLFWWGREKLYYKNRWYARRAERYSGLLRGTQKNMGLIENIFSKILKKSSGSLTSDR